MDRSLLTIDDVALQFNVSTSTVRRWVRSGKLVGHKAGAQWRFDPTTVREAFERGVLEGASRPLSSPGLIAQYLEPPEWARPLLARWGRSLKEQLEQIQPDHVIVNDRRGAKVWALIVQNRYRWGENLWHSTAIDIMASTELQRIFGHRRVVLFDEMMQHGREMHELRERLAARDVGAIVTSVVCVRRRSHAESGELLEYEALACEDVDDTQFTERAAFISRLVHLFEPPLDVDHLVVRGSLTPGLKGDELLEKLAKWGLPFVVWHIDKEHKFMAITLDRPQFFDVGNSDGPNGFSFGWESPCKVRLYVNFENRVCYCSLIVYPDVEAPRSTWTKASLIGRTKQISAMVDEAALRRVYWTICMNLAVKLLNDFVASGAADEVGIRLDNSGDAINIGQLRATFGRPLGDEIVKRTREILIRAARGKSIFSQVAQMAQNPPPLLIRKEPKIREDNCDEFKCRTQLLKATPPRYSPDDSTGQQRRPISYGELLRRLDQYSETTVGRVLDYELDRGTIKPLVRLDLLSQDGVQIVKLGRGFCRGEFGVWFEWDRSVLSHDDLVIQRTLALGPTVVDRYLRRTGEPRMTATHFDKTFANLQHDLCEGAHDLLYLGWKPYKYGPVPIVPVLLASSEFMEFERFLVDMECLTETRERHGSQIWRRYEPASDTKVPWRKLYELRTSGITRAHVAGLIRLYAAIQQECKTVRPSDPRSSGLSVFQDPLVVLAAARNNVIAYRCGWFEVRDWRAKGQILFPLLNAVALSGSYPPKPFLKRHLEELAAPARLLFDKIEMYRNLPYLQQQVANLVDQGDFEAGIILLETIDSEPRFESRSANPMQNLEWACTIMRAFSSMTRQVLTACGLDVDERIEKADDKGTLKDASFYLNELLAACPELQVLESDLRGCIAKAKDGVLTEEMAGCLTKTFYLILTVFDGQQRIPDPRPQYEQDREQLQVRDGLLARLRAIPLPEPYAVAVADIKNLRNLPMVADIFGVPYDEALDSLLRWVEKAARDVVKRHPNMVLGGLPADNVILAGPDADGVFSGTLDLIKETTRRLAAVDRNLFAPFGVLRAGIAWHQNGMGEGFRGVQPGVIAYDLGEKPGQELGTIAITKALYDHLSPQHQSGFASTNEEMGQGTVFVRHWNPVSDLE